MARVLGVGGVFFRSPDPRALGEWYQRWLGVPVSYPHGASFPMDSMPKNGLTVWTPFDQDTTYFGSGEQQFMFNLVVDELDEALAQVEQGGARRAGNVEEYEYGRFGWFIDPDGNRVELWEPPAAR